MQAEGNKTYRRSRRTQKLQVEYSGVKPRTVKRRRKKCEEKGETESEYTETGESDIETVVSTSTPVSSKTTAPNFNLSGVLEFKLPGTSEQTTSTKVYDIETGASHIVLADDPGTSASILSNTYIPNLESQEDCEIGDILIDPAEVEIPNTLNKVRLNYSKNSLTHRKPEYTAEYFKASNSPSDIPRFSINNHKNCETVQQSSAKNQVTPDLGINPYERKRFFKNRFPIANASLPAGTSAATFNPIALSPCKEHNQGETEGTTDKQPSKRQKRPSITEVDRTGNPHEIPTSESENEKLPTHTSDQGNIPHIVVQESLSPNSESNGILGAIWKSTKNFFGGRNNSNTSKSPSVKSYQGSPAESTAHKSVLERPNIPDKSQLSSSTAKSGVQPRTPCLQLSQDKESEARRALFTDNQNQGLLENRDIEADNHQNRETSVRTDLHNPENKSLNNTSNYRDRKDSTSSSSTEEGENSHSSSGYSRLEKELKETQRNINEILRSSRLEGPILLNSQRTSTNHCTSVTDIINQYRGAQSFTTGNGNNNQEERASTPPQPNGGISQRLVETPNSIRREITNYATPIAGNNPFISTIAQGLFGPLSQAADKFQRSEKQETCSISHSESSASDKEANNVADEAEDKNVQANNDIEEHNGANRNSENNNNYQTRDSRIGGINSDPLTRQAAFEPPRGNPFLDDVLQAQLRAFRSCSTWNNQAVTPSQPDPVSTGHNETSTQPKQPQESIINQTFTKSPPKQPSRKSSSSSSGHPNIHSDTSSDTDTEQETIMNNEAFPKYTSKLSTNALTQYLKTFQPWAKLKKMKDEQMKIALITLIDNPEANQWFSLNAELTTDPKIDFEEFVNTFLNDCPMHDRSKCTIVQVLQQKPKIGEEASSYLLRMRFTAGASWDEMTEETICDHLVNNLPQHVKDFIDVKGRPVTFNELKKEIKKFERTRDSSPQVTAPVATMATLGPTSFATPVTQEMEELRSGMSNLYKELAEIRAARQNATPVVNESPVFAPVRAVQQQQEPQNSNTDRTRENRDDRQYDRQEDRRGNRRDNWSNDRGRNDCRGRDNRVCDYCDRTGHIYRQCRTRMADENRERGNRNPRRGGRNQGGDWGRSSRNDQPPPRYDDSERQYNQQRRSYQQDQYDRPRRPNQNNGQRNAPQQRDQRQQQPNWSRRPTMQWEPQGAGQRYDNPGDQYRDDGQADEGYYDQEN